MSTNNKKICPGCTEISKEQCDPICREVHTTNCIVHEGALSCIGIEEGSSTPLSEILPLLCDINGEGGSITVETTPSISCPNGGTTVQMGIDTNGDYAIDIPLVTFDICNGEDGADGADGETPDVQLFAEPNGPNCPQGGAKLVVNGVTTYICSGIDGQDGQDGEDGITPFLDLDFSCLEGLGVDIGDDITENFQALINTVCYVLEGNPTPPTQPVAANLQFEVCEGETIEINLLQGSILDSPAIDVNFTPTNGPDGFVTYNPINPSATGLVDVTGDSLGTEVRTYEIVTSGGTSNEATVTINVVECEEPSIEQEFYNCIPPPGKTYSYIKLTRYSDTGIELSIPTNPTNFYNNFFIKVTTNVQCADFSIIQRETVFQLNTAGTITSFIPNAYGDMNFVGTPSISNTIGSYIAPSCPSSPCGCLVNQVQTTQISLYGTVTVNGNTVVITEGDPGFTFAFGNVTSSIDFQEIISPACI